MAGKVLYDVMGLLAEYSTQNLPVTRLRLNQLNSEGLENLYNFLRQPPRARPKDGVVRPECPAKDMNHAALARHSYKVSLAEYIARWGYRFPTILNKVPFPLLEAIANFLERLPYEDDKSV